MTQVNESERRAELDRFYRTYRGLLISRVLRRVGAIDLAQAEDACQTAWAILARRSDIDLDPRGLAWITQVAVREGWRLAHTAACTVGPGAWDPEEVLALVAADSDDPLDRAIDREQHDERAAGLAALKLASSARAQSERLLLHRDRRPHRRELHRSEPPPHRRPRPTSRRRQQPRPTRTWEGASFHPAT